MIDNLQKSNVDAIIIEKNVRHSSRRPVPNSKYVNDYISPTIRPTVPRGTSPKWQNLSSIVSFNTSPVLNKFVLAVDTHAPENRTTNTPLMSKPVRWKRKNVKQSSWNSPNPKEFPEIKRSSTTVDTLKLPWARYGIRNTLHEQRIYLVINTYPLDTGLFSFS